MNFQFRSFKFFIVIALLTIVSLTIYTSKLPTVPVSVGKEHTIYIYGRQAYLVTHVEQSETNKSSNKSETEFSVIKLQRTKQVENITALKLSSPDHRDTEHSNVKKSVSSGAGFDCKVPPGGFRSWTRGTVTKVTPEIHANCTVLFKGGSNEYKLEVLQVLLASRSWPAKAHALRFSKLVKNHDRG